jgi:hypothetical protein
MASIFSTASRIIAGITGYGAADGDCLRVRVGVPFVKDFDSQFDSHGLGEGRMKGARAEIGTRYSARFGRGRTRFYRT